MKKTDKSSNRNQEPVSDGDSRPDHQPQGQHNISTSQDGGVTIERVADKNSLENFRDSKNPSGKKKDESKPHTSAVPRQHDEENE